MKYSLIWIFVGTAVAAVLFLGIKFFTYSDRPVKYIQTAEEYVQNIDSPDWSFHYKYRLSDDEVQKTVSVLRSRYPVTSLRSRLNLDKIETASIHEARQSHGLSDASFSVRKRIRALSELHSENVERFIKQPGVGISRAMDAYPHDLKLKDEFAESVESVVVKDSLDESVVSLKHVGKDASKHLDVLMRFTKRGMPNAELTEHFHETILNGFTRPETRGYIINIDEVIGFESHRIRLDKSWTGSIRITEEQETKIPKQYFRNQPIDWKTNRLQLVGILLHEQPRVYVSERLPNMSELNGSNAKTRELNQFESESLEQLVSGEQIVTRATPNRIVMLGGIRAKDSCLECHSGKENSLLGAFSYEFLRDPAVDLKSLDF